ncbi:Uncharacterised protein [Fusobacterium necrophorum subsp. necrophorum]|nr:Uncharacterised protein [Fusobacterium necrophorum subsp. necrophorum]
MMIFPLDNNSKTPLYIQMYTEIKKQIQTEIFVRMRGFLRKKILWNTITLVKVQFRMLYIFYWKKATFIR